MQMQVTLLVGILAANGPTVLSPAGTYRSPARVLCLPNATKACRIWGRTMRLRR